MPIKQSHVIRTRPGLPAEFFRVNHAFARYLSVALESEDTPSMFIQDFCNDDKEV